MTKTVAIAGSGPVARYLIEEFIKQKIRPVVLTRKEKDFLAKYDISARVTDYTIDDLVEKLVDCDGVVSTISAPSEEEAISIHLNFLEACKRSPKCKHFMPNIWSSNIEDFPSQPMGTWGKRGPVIDALKQQTDVKWTLLLIGWFMDYVVPKEQRYLGEVGGMFPMDWPSKTFTIWGTGRYPVNFVSARDAAKGVAALFHHEDWDPYTYLQGTQCSWLDLLAAVQKRGDSSWTVKSKTLADSVNQFVENASPYANWQARFEITSNSGALELPEAKADAQKAKYFKDVHFRSLEEYFDEAKQNPSAIM